MEDRDLPAVPADTADSPADAASTPPDTPEARLENLPLPGPAEGAADPASDLSSAPAAEPDPAPTDTAAPEAAIASSDNAETAEPESAPTADDTPEPDASPAATDTAAPEAALASSDNAETAEPESAPAPAGDAESEPTPATPEPTAATETAEAEPGSTATDAADREDAPAAAEISMEELLPAAPEPETVSLEDAQLRAVIEAIVYVAEEPLTLAQLSAALQQPQDRVRSILDQIITEFDKPEHGVTVREVAGGFKMATKPEHHEAVRAFVKSLKPPLKLSLPALETLAVIAYKQPVTGPEIQEIRGVQGGGVLKTLLDRKLIAVAGRKNVIGKPMLYKTTKEFLIQFGLKDLTELPSLKEFEEIRRMAFTDEPAPAAAPSEPVSEAQPEPAQGVSPDQNEPEPQEA